MKHRGDILRKEIDKSKVSKSKIAQELGITRRTLYNYFEEADLPYPIIEKVGEIIMFDFSVYFPELLPKNPDQESSYKELAEIWRNKYINLLEKYNKSMLEREEKLMTLFEKKISSISKSLSQIANRFKDESE